MTSWSSRKLQEQLDLNLTAMKELLTKLSDSTVSESKQQTYLRKLKKLLTQSNRISAILDSQHSRYVSFVVYFTILSFSFTLLLTYFFLATDQSPQSPTVFFTKNFSVKNTFYQTTAQVTPVLFLALTVDLMGHGIKQKTSKESLIVFFGFLAPGLLAFGVSLLAILINLEDGRMVLPVLMGIFYMIAYAIIVYSLSSSSASK